MKITPNASAISNCSQEFEKINPGSPHHPTRSSNRRIQWKAPPKAKGRGQSESRTRETSTGPEEATRIIDRCEAEASRTLWTYGKSAGAIQIWDGSPSRASTSSATPPHTESKDSDGG